MIYHAVSDTDIGGAGVLLCTLATHTDQEKMPMQILLPKASRLCEMLHDHGIAYTTLNGVSDTSFSFSDIPVFASFFASHPCQLLFTHGLFSARIGAKMHRIPTVSVKHCDTPMPRGVKRAVYRFFTDATVAVSRPCAAHIRESGIPEDEIFCIENGFVPMHPPTLQERQAARAKYGLTENEIAVGMVGRLAAVKGHTTLLRAAARLKKQDSFRFFLLGDGPEKASLCREVRRLGIGDRVIFCGFSPDTRTFYHAMDAHVSCSVCSETSSLALAEGMSAALPTFATAIAGNVCRIGSGGDLFAVGDDAALAALLAPLVQADYRRKKSRSAFLRASTLPTADGMAKQYQDLCAIFAAKTRKKRKPVAFLPHIW